MTTVNNPESQALRDVIAAFRSVSSQTQSIDNAAEAAREAAQQAANAAEAAREAAQQAANAAQAARDATTTIRASSAATIAAIDAATNALIRLESAIANRRCPHCGQLVAA